MKKSGDTDREVLAKFRGRPKLTLRLCGTFVPKDGLLSSLAMTHCRNARRDSIFWLVCLRIDIGSGYQIILEQWEGLAVKPGLVYF
jgi:hypothetical protein